MDVLRLRKGARMTLALASLAIIAGGFVIVYGNRALGDGMMIAGAALLILGTIVLVRVPTGDKDARR